MVGSLPAGGASWSLATRASVTVAVTVQHSRTYTWGIVEAPPYLDGRRRTVTEGA